MSIERKESIYAISLILISSLLLLSYAPYCGMKYDAAMYAGIAYNLYHNHSYSYNGAKGDLPPAYPLMLASAYVFGENAIDYVTPVNAIFLLIFSFLFLRIFISRKFSFLLSLLILLNPAIFEYSIGHFRDIPALLFTLIFYYIYERNESGEKRSKNELSLRDAVLIGFSFAIAFLITYSAFFYFLPLLINSIIKKRKNILISFFASILIISPWMLWSKANHGKLLVEHSSYLISYASTKYIRYFFGFILKQFIKFSLPLFILAIAGFAYELGKEKHGILKNPYFLLALVLIPPNAIWPEQTVRYIFPLLISLLYFSAKFIEAIDNKKNAKKLILVFLIVSLAISGFASIKIADYNCKQFSLVEDAGKWLRKNAGDSKAFLAGSFYQISYFSGKVTYQLPKSIETAEKLMKIKSIRYVVVDSYEKSTPGYAYTYFERKCKLVKEFRDGNDFVKIYDCSELSS